MVQKKKTMKNKRGTWFMVLGGLLLAVAFALVCANVITDNMASNRSARLISMLNEQIPDHSVPDDGIGDDLAVKEMQTIEIDGQAYIGVLDMPSLGLSLPVLSNWSDALLKISPCCYSGSFLDGSMIIAGHNYKKHFGRISRLVPGDSITFTDVLGNVYHYRVSSTETVDGTDTEGMMSGDWSLTLFTCTMSGRSRITIRCEPTM